MPVIFFLTILMLTTLIQCEMGELQRTRTDHQYYFMVDRTEEKIYCRTKCRNFEECWCKSNRSEFDTTRPINRSRLGNGSCKCHCKKKLKCPRNTIFDTRICMCLKKRLPKYYQLVI